MRSKKIETIEGEIVYIPVARMGRFYGWMLLNVKYFSEATLREIRSAEQMLAADAARRYEGETP